jgi:hypothetical protein
VSVVLFRQSSERSSKAFSKGHHCHLQLYTGECSGLRRSSTKGSELRNRLQHSPQLGGDLVTLTHVGTKAYSESFDAMISESIGIPPSLSLPPFR